MIKIFNFFTLISKDVLVINGVNYSNYCLGVLNGTWVALDLDHEELEVTTEPSNSEATKISETIQKPEPRVQEAGSSLYYPLIESINVITMCLVIHDFYKESASGSNEIKACFIGFIAIFLAEQVIQITWHFVSNPVLVIIKNSMTVLCYSFVACIWMLSVPGIQEIAKKCLAFFGGIAGIEITFLLICFLKKNVGELFFILQLYAIRCLKML
jgi:hypothetical protein